MADILKDLGLAGVIAGIGDAVVSGERMVTDVVGILFGILLLIQCVRLTGKSQRGKV